MKHDARLTHLLLLNLRDGGLDEQIQAFPAELVLEQEARLIDDGLATGKAIEDAGKLRWVKGLKISSAGHRWLESKESSEMETRDPKANVSVKRDRMLQRLLLLRVRDGVNPPELAGYSERQIVHNGALLIRDGCVEGQAIENGSGICVSTVMTELTSKGHDFLEQFENTPADSSLMPKTSKLIFVSHSGADKDLADALLDMLCTALHLKLSDFVCTSVHGAKLRGGDDTDEVLRREIRDVPAFLSILSRQAVSSTYVLFELGARWGCVKHHIPLLAKGASAEILKEPLKATNALRLGEEADVLQLIEDLAGVISRNSQPANTFLRKVRKVVEISNAGSEPSVLSKAIAQAMRDPKRMSEDAELVLKELAAQGDLVVDPMRDPKSFNMHRVRLEKCVSTLISRKFLEKTSSTMIDGWDLFVVTPAGKQYLFDHNLV